MAAVGTRESWDAGGLTFDQPSVGTTGDAEAEDVWDDRAILKAFDDALNTHTRKPVDGVEARKWNKHAAQEVAAQPSTAATRVPFSAPTTPRGITSSNTPAGLSSTNTAAAAFPHHPRSVDGGQGQSHGQGFQAADRRFATLLTKGNAEASSGGGGGPRVLPAGIPGPWEPVAGPSEGHQYSRGIPQDGGGQRFEYARPGPYDPYQQRGQEYNSSGAHSYPYPPRGAPQHPLPPHPAGGAAANFEEGGSGRHGLPPPPQPPHPGVGPHAAAFQSLDGVHDDDLADLLLAWYYSGYYTGRYKAMQAARKTRNYRRQYAPPPSMPPTGHGSYHGSHHGSHHGGGGGGEGWGGEPNGGWHGQQIPMPPPSMLSSPAKSGRGL